MISIMMKFGFSSFIVSISSLFRSSESAPLSVGLLDPDLQNIFVETLPNPLDPIFIYNISTGYIEIGVSGGSVETGIKDAQGNPLLTSIWGYGTPVLGYTWPGRTLEVHSGENLQVKWTNDIPIEPGYLLTGKNNGATLGDYSGMSVVDTTFHWAYSLKGYEDYTIEEHGTPIVAHVHGGHTQDIYDGNPEFFFSPGHEIKGPQWAQEVFLYDNSQPAACLWYHDHALGITRLNVYAGMAGFYIIRDRSDTGKVDNPLKLPAFPYEIPLLIQDRMFKENGELFYPSFPGDPYYADFITGEGAEVGADDPTAMAEVFGDHIVVNGKIWPRLEVEPRNYRFRLLNGCDSRFLVIEFVAVELGEVNVTNGEIVPFFVIGGDQGLGSEAVQMQTVVLEPGARLDVVFDFSGYDGKRIIIKNMGGDEPFGGEYPGPQLFNHTDKIVAFDVVGIREYNVTDEFDPGMISFPFKIERVAERVRRVGLFEGRDQFGRLQPLLGTVDPATDKDGNPIHWPNNEHYRDAGLEGQIMPGTLPWHAPTTENVKVGDAEEWEIWNFSEDAHPLHFHLINFYLVSRRMIKFDSNADDGIMEDGDEPAGDGTYMTERTLVQHDGTHGVGYNVFSPTYGGMVDLSTLPVYANNFPRDTIVALPGQVTTIKAQFDRQGRYNWHCHILSHEDHEMMRIFHVGELPEDQKPQASEDDEDEESGDFSAGAIIGMIVVVALILVTLAYGWYTFPRKEIEETKDPNRPEEAPPSVAETKAETVKLTSMKQAEISSEADSCGGSQSNAPEGTPNNPTENV